MVMADQLQLLGSSGSILADQRQDADVWIWTFLSLDDSSWLTQIARKTAKADRIETIGKKAAMMIANWTLKVASISGLLCRAPVH